MPKSVYSSCRFKKVAIKKPLTQHSPSQQIKHNVFADNKDYFDKGSLCQAPLSGE